AYHAVQERLTGTSREIWKWLIPEWAERSAREAYPPDAEAERAAPAEGDARQRWVRTAEDFLAIQTVLYLSQEFNHARNLLGGLVLSSVLALLAVLSYPMQPHNLLISSFVVMTV